MIYVIWCKENRLWWSNEFGWVESGADTFSQKERETVNLPMGGQWFNLTTGELEQ
jgi:hypothetical protein